MSFFNPDSPMMRSLSKMGDLIVLNLLWLVCCLPVVTAGASTAAMYSVELKLARDDDGSILRRFFKAFRQNFKQATVIHLALCVMTALLVFDFYSYAHNDSRMPGLLQVVLTAVAIIAVVFLSWVYPLVAQFENTTIGTCRNALKLAALHLSVTLRITLTNVLFGILTFVVWFIWPGLLIFWFAFSGSCAAYLNAIALRRCFIKYIPVENAEKTD